MPESPASPRGPHLRRAMALTTWAWVFGNVWATATAGAPLTEFARGLGTSNLQFGILSALPFIATLVCLPAAVITERSGMRKIIFLLTLYTQRLMWIPIALVPLWMMSHGMRTSAWAADCFLLMMLFMYAAGAAGGPAWTSWMADLVPESIRGKYFSVRRQFANLSGIPAAIVVGILMDHHVHGQNLGKISWDLMIICSTIFIGSAIFGVADIHLFHYIPDIHRPAQRTPWFKSLGRPLRDKQFLWFAAFVATLTFAVSFMGQFVTLYLEEQVHASNTGTQLITLAAPMIAQLFMLSVWGNAVDRMGKKPVLAIASAGLVPVGLGWCFMTTQRIWLGYLLSALGGMLWAGIEVANFNMVLEMSATQEAGREGDSSFFAVNCVIINIAGCLGGVCAGLIAEEFSSMHWQPIRGLKVFTFFDILFALSALLRLAAVAALLPKIKETSAAPARQALRFMTANFYNNVFQAILQPLRMVGVRPEESYRARNDDREIENPKTKKPRASVSSGRPPAGRHCPWEPTALHEFLSDSLSHS
jgi:MFS family permease